LDLRGYLMLGSNDMRRKLSVAIVIALLDGTNLDSQVTGTAPYIATMMHRRAILTGLRSTAWTSRPTRPSQSIMMLLRLRG